LLEQDEKSGESDGGDGREAVKKVRPHSSGAVFFDSLVSGSFLSDSRPSRKVGVRIGGGRRDAWFLFTSREARGGDEVARFCAEKEGSLEMVFKDK
jgi:hypothetical protein